MGLATEQGSMKDW